jgi:hypothetical protein
LTEWTVETNPAVCVGNEGKQTVAEHDEAGACGATQYTSGDLFDWRKRRSNAQRKRAEKKAEAGKKREDGFMMEKDGLVAGYGACHT